MDTKNRRDRELLPRVSLLQQRTATAILMAIGVGLLFYIYLFAIRQTNSRQVAWLLSFAVWISFEIFIVSSLSVLVQHVVIPSLVAQDAQVVKKKIMKDITTFKNKFASPVPHRHSSATFNAAKYFYSSWRIAQLHPELPESAMVSRFSTPHPKRSMKRQTRSVSKAYNKKFTFIGRAVSRIVLYMIIGFVQVPPVIQDIIVQLCITSGVGYVITLFARLYKTFPLLIILPIALLMLLVHFMHSSNKMAVLALLNDRRSMKNAAKGSKSAQVTPDMSDLRTPNSTLIIEKRDTGNVVTVGDGEPVFMTDAQLSEFLCREYTEKSVNQDINESQVTSHSKSGNLRRIQSELMMDSCIVGTDEADVSEEEKAMGEILKPSQMLRMKSVSRHSDNSILENPRPLSLEDILKRRGLAVAPIMKSSTDLVSGQDTVRKRSSLLSSTSPPPSSAELPLSLEALAQKRVCHYNDEMSSTAPPALLTRLPMSPGGLLVAKTRTSMDTVEQSDRELPMSPETLRKESSLFSPIPSPSSPERPLSLEEILRRRASTMTPSTAQHLSLEALPQRRTPLQSLDKPSTAPASATRRLISPEEMLEARTHAWLGPAKQSDREPPMLFTDTSSTRIGKSTIDETPGVDNFMILGALQSDESSWSNAMTPNDDNRYQSSKQISKKKVQRRNLKDISIRQQKPRSRRTKSPSKSAELQQPRSPCEDVMPPLYDADDEVDHDAWSSESEGISNPII